MKKIWLSAFLIVASASAARAATTVNVQIPPGAVPIEALVQSTGTNEVAITVLIQTSKGIQGVKLKSIVDLPDPISIHVESNGKTVAVFMQALP